MDWRQRILGQRRIAAHRSIEGLSNVDRWQRILCGRCPTTDRGIEFLEDALKRLLRRSAQVAVAAVMVVSPAFAALTCLQPVAAILRGLCQDIEDLTIWSGLCRLPPSPSTPDMPSLSSVEFNCSA